MHVGFNQTTATDPTFGEIAYYSLTAGAAATPITVASGSQIVFMADTTSPHTASGLGSSFPASFDNTSAPTATGNTIGANTTWSTGTLEAGQSSQVFTVGPPGDYFFGCFYHYSIGMRDVIVSQ